MTIAESPTDVFPTHLELPCSDGKPVENAYQPLQSMLLTGSLKPLLDRFHADGNYLVAADMGIYWRRTKNPLEGCKAPDWYYVPNVPPLLDGSLRRSYVLWQEYAKPLLLIEYVSGTGSEERDQTPLTGKFWVYEHIIQPTYYVIHDPEREELTVYELVRGRFQQLTPTPAGRFRVAPLEIELGIWSGEYLGGPANWLRAWDLKGVLIPTPQELIELEQGRAAEERKRAEEERKRADREQDRANKLAVRLRELGIDPNTV
jgi:Uma2 family endonuclease